MCAAIARALPLIDEPDTRVVDVDLSDAEDLTVQIELFEQPGIHHRKVVGGLETACGRRIDYRLCLGQRSESYRGKLCTDGCFSPHELRLSIRANAMAFVPDFFDD